MSEEKPSLEVVQGARKGRRGRYSNAFKAATLEKFSAAENKVEWAKKQGIPLTTIYHWRDEAKRHRPGRKAKGKPGPPSADLGAAFEEQEELEVLIRLLRLPVPALERISAYLLARRK